MSTSAVCISPPFLAVVVVVVMYVWRWVRWRCGGGGPLVVEVVVDRGDG